MRPPFLRRPVNCRGDGASTMISSEFNEIFRKYASDKEIFHDLMPLRAREILLVAPAFDAFTLEQDGLLTEILFDGYYQLNMSNPPRVTNVSTVDEALEKCSSRHFDMIIVMSRLGQGGHVELSKALKKAAPRTPIYLLLNDNVEVGALDRRRQELQRSYDQIFVWNGNPEVFMAMVKFMEDRANVENDTSVGLTRVILLVEDSIRYYSRYLPILYSELLKQTTRLAKDHSADGMSRTLAMRVRPKVLLATTYEEAIAFAERYRDYLLCVITDRKYPKDGALDREAGIKLIKAVKDRNPYLPTLLQSSDPFKESWATAIKSGFLNKNSYTLGAELSAFFHESLGFGDFIFRNEHGQEIARAVNMEDLQAKLRTVPVESLVYHASRNHFSAWIMARGEVQVAKVLGKFRITDYRDPEEMRTFLINVGDYVQRMKTLGKVVPLTESTPKDEPNILRLAPGSMGGKGRGVAFIHSLLARMDLDSLVPDANIRIPRSAIIGTEEFTSFIGRHGLRQMLQNNVDDDLIKRRFLTGSLSPELVVKLRLFLANHARGPLAVRSSGLLEDSLSHPFAGLYNTFFLPNNDPDPACGRPSSSRPSSWSTPRSTPRPPAPTSRPSTTRSRRSRWPSSSRRSPGAASAIASIPTSPAWPSPSTTTPWPTPSPRTASPTSPWAWGNTWWRATSLTGSRRPTPRWTCCPPRSSSAPPRSTSTPWT